MHPTGQLAGSSLRRTDQPIRPALEGGHGGEAGRAGSPGGPEGAELGRGRCTRMGWEVGTGCRAHHSGQALGLRVSGEHSPFEGVGVCVRAEIKPQGGAPRRIGEDSD